MWSFLLGKPKIYYTGGTVRANVFQASTGISYVHLGSRPYIDVKLKVDSRENSGIEVKCFEFVLKG